MDFKKFLEMTAEAELLEAKKESTSEKDHKAEKAGKKVAKDIEYDEGHKGKDDNKAEKAGKKVTKDIEYDDKKDKKKKSLKDWFEQLDKELINEAEQVTLEPAKQNTQVIKQGTKTLGTVTNPQLAAQIKQSIGKGEMSLAGHEIKEEEVEESGLQAYLGKKKYGEKGMKALQKAGREGASKEKMAKIRAQHDKLDEVEIDEKVEIFHRRAPGADMQRYSKDASNPAAVADRKAAADAAKKLRASGDLTSKKMGHGSIPTDKGGAVAAQSTQSSGFKKGSGMVEAKAKNPYAIGMAQAMKSAGDKPPLKKSTITKAHDIAKSIKKKTDEAEIPSSGPDYGAGLGAGRSDNVLEAKPDFLDLDKDGNKKESMKKAAADKKKKVKESMNTLEAAYHEGKSHGLSKHGYACRYNEGSEEHKRYHDGFKEGLDECYGLMPNRGLVGETMPATVPGMADQAAGLGEMDKTAYMQHKAKTTPGDTFKAFGQTMHDKDVLEMDAFAFESLDKQLNDLLNEGLSVNMSQGLNDGMGGHGSDSVSVTATDDDAAKLLDFIKQVGLGGLGAAADAHGEPAVVATVSDYGAPKFQGHDDMVGLMKLAGGEDYKDEGSHDHAHEEKMCETHGMEEAKCGCGEAVEETETADQRLYNMAEENAPDSEEAEHTADEDAEAKEDEALAKADQQDKEETVNEGGDGGEASEEPEMTEEKLDEWANDAGKKGTDQAFERDIDFMTKVISGGLNKPKSTGQTTIPVIASQDARDGDEDVQAWKKLAGLAK